MTVRTTPKTIVIYHIPVKITYIDGENTQLGKGPCIDACMTEGDRIGPTAEMIDVRQRLEKEIVRRNHWISVLLKTKGETKGKQLSSTTLFIRSTNY